MCEPGCTVWNKTLCWAYEIPPNGASGHTIWTWILICPSWPHNPFSIPFPSAEYPSVLHSTIVTPQRTINLHPLPHQLITPVSHPSLPCSVTTATRTPLPVLLLPSIRPRTAQVVPSVPVRTPTKTGQRYQISRSGDESRIGSHNGIIVSTLPPCRQALNNGVHMLTNDRQEDKETSRRSRAKGRLIIGLSRAISCRASNDSSTTSEKRRRFEKEKIQK